MLSLTPGSDSMTDSSNTDCALSVTGPYESTAIVTGPMPRKPNATRPNANTAGAAISAPMPNRLTRYAAPISEVSQQSVVFAGRSAAQLRPLIEVTKLHPQDGALHAFHAVVESS